MNKEEQKYLDLLKEVIDTGEDRNDRTGVGTKALFGRTLRFDLSKGTLPLITTKRIFWKGVVEELLFFLRGETQTKKLEERGVNIWKGNTSREFLDSRGLYYLPEGSYGKSYGYQWRNFNGTIPVEGDEPNISIGKLYGLDDKTVEDLEMYKLDIRIDQITDVFKSLKEDPHGRRHLITAWNPSQLNEMSLPCCHYSFQFYVSNKNELSCLFNMRSVDTFLGLPFNIASYALLTHIFAKALGYTAKELIWVGADTHIYSNHIEAVKEQLSRKSLPFPTIQIKKEISSVEDVEKLSLEDIELLDYKCLPAIKVSMAV